MKTNSPRKSDLQTVEKPAAHSETNGVPPTARKVVERVAIELPQQIHRRTAEWQDRLLAGGLWVLAGRVLGVLATLLSNVILARLLEPKDFGNFLLMISMAAVGAVVAMFGMNGVIVKMVGESVGFADPDRACRVFHLGATVAATSILLVGLASPWVLFHFLPEMNLTPVVLVSIAIGIMLLAWQQVVAEGLRGLHEQRWASLLSGGQLSGPLTALLLIVFVLVAASIRPLTLSATIWLMDLALVFTVAIAMVCLWRTAADRLSTLGDGLPTYRPVLKLKDVVALGTTLMIMQVLMFTTSHSDVWIAGMCFRSDSVALYGAARRLAAVVVMLPQIAGVAISAPIATLNAQGRLAEMQQFVRTTATLTAIPSMIACLAFIAAGGLILEILFGPFYRQAAGALAVLAIGQAVVAWCGLSGYVLIMTGHQNVAVIVNLITTVALLTIGPWAGVRFGMLGVSWTSTLLLIIHTVVMWALTGRLVGVWTHGTLAIPSFAAMVIPGTAKEGSR